MEAFKSFAAGSKAMKNLETITLGSMETLENIVFNPGATERLEEFLLSSGALEAIKDIINDPKAMEAFDGAIIEHLDATNSSLPDSHQTMLFDDAGAYLYERYKSTKLILHLERAIQATQRVIEISPPGDKNLPQRLYALMSCLVSKYKHTNNLGDLNSIVDVTRAFINAITTDHPCYTDAFKLLPSLLRYRFSQTANMADIEEVICLNQDALNATLLNNSSRAENSILMKDSISIYIQCGKDMMEKYSITKSKRDLEEAIYIFYASAENCHEDNLLLALCLGELGICLALRFSFTEVLPDIDAAILILQEAVRIIPTDHSSRIKWLCYLAALCHHKFGMTRATADLSDAICLNREALNNSSLDHEIRDMFVSTLAFLLIERCGHTGTFDDIEQSVFLFREIINTTTCSADRAGLLLRFSWSLHTLFEYTGAISYLDESIQIVREALSDASCDLEIRLLCLVNLSSYLHHSYAIFQRISDLEESILLLREATECISLNSSYRSEIFISIGACLMARSKRTRAIGDLNEAISIFQSMLDIPDTASIGYNGRLVLTYLASALSDRFHYSGEIADLTEAILVSQEAIRVSVEHSDRTNNLHNLSIYHWQRHKSTGQVADLEEAIRISQNAIDLTLTSHPHRAGYLIHLGKLLSRKIARAKAIKSLILFFIMERINHVSANTYCLKAFTTCKKYGFDMKLLINDINLEHLLDEINIMHLVDEIKVEHILDAIKVELLFDENKMEYLLDDNKMGHFLENIIQEHFLIRLEAIIDSKLTHVDTMAVIQNARQCFVDALYHEPADVLTRFKGGRDALLSPDFLEDPKAYDIARDTINLIPLLTSRSLQNSDKQYVLAKVVGTSSNAAAIALHTLSVDQGPIAAVECLETGRGVIGSALFEQYDLKSLEKCHPLLARSFSVLRDQYNQPAPQYSVLETNNPSMMAEIENDRRHRSEKEFTNLLKTIRSKKHFEHFLLPASEIDMLQAASVGPIVILNWSTFRCDALVIEQSGLRNIPLPRLSGDIISEISTNIRSKDPESLQTLAWLWDDVVGPVLDALGFTSTPSDDCWPHIWWIPTGPLIKLPLHAAGHHLRRSGETTLDRVVSSYATSVKAIIHSRKRSAPVAEKSLSLVAVAMDKTEGFTPLLHANREVDVVVDILESKGVDCRRPQQLKNDIISAVENCQIFHFAGHGRTHPTDPLQSALLLEDWQDKPFTVASLLEINLNLNSPFLAYLSACGTGQILDDEAVDESIHLVSACQLAGFRHVIGTLWSVDDKLCVDIAEMIYGSLSKGFRDEYVSWALHNAVRTLRDRWIDAFDQRSECEDRAADGLREGRHAQLDEDEELGRPLWIPYVHYGA